MLVSLREVVATATMTLALGSCRVNRPPAAASASQSASSLHWASGYSDPQAAVVDTLIRQAVAAGTLSSDPVDGEIYSFFSSSDGGRLLLITTNAEHRLVLYALAGKVMRPLSPPFDVGVPDDPYRFQQVDLRDFDGDGATDLQFCTWPTHSGPPEMTLVGYVDQGWYHVVPKFQPVPCPPGGAP